MKLARALACGLTLTAGRASSSTGELPASVSYIAPRECATADAFEQLVGEEVARQPKPDRPWRFSVTIRHQDDFVGTLETEGGTRQLHAATCDEVTAALAMIIATVQSQLPAASPPPPQPKPVSPLLVREPPAPIQDDKTWLASPARLGIGIAVTTAGVAAVPFGILHIVNARVAAEVCPGGVVCQRPTQRADVTGIALVGAGAGLAVGGFVLAVLGLQREHFSVEGGPVGSTGVTLKGTL